MNGLAGRRVVVTRSRDQAGAMCEALAACGAEPVLFPTIAIHPLESTDTLDAALNVLGSYRWVIFTSANGVRFFLERWAVRADASWPASVRIAAVGAATAAALEARGLRAAVMPDKFRGEALPAVLQGVQDCRVLLPRADIGRQAIVAALAAAGAEVHDLTVYRTVPAAPDADGLAALRRGVDVVTFTSPSTVRNFLALLGDEGRRVLGGAVVGSIGPVTTEAACAAGIRVDVQPDEYTVPGLVDALARHAAVDV